MRQSYRIFFAVIISLTIGFTSCKPEQNTYDIPSTYNFDKVSYPGQSTRLAKLGEITAYLKEANIANAAVLDASKIKDMYGANTGSHFSTTELNIATQQLKNKTISTDTSIFMTYMDAIATVSAYTSQNALNGQAGIAYNNAGNSYLLNTNGIEMTQIIEKGLMGACFYYQATAVYMGSAKMDVDNTTIDAIEGTEMEHHWDEAFGYFGVPTNFPIVSAGALFWGKYSYKHQNTYPLSDKMMDAFIKGRAAISAKDISTRDEQISELRKQWELIVAATAIYYLNKAKDNLSINPKESYHELSEVFGFIMSLKYGAGTNSITNSDVNSILSNLYGSSDPLQAINYDVTVEKIEAAKTSLVGYFTDLLSVKDSL